MEGSEVEKRGRLEEGRGSEKGEEVRKLEDLEKGDLGELEEQGMRWVEDLEDVGEEEFWRCKCRPCTLNGTAKVRPFVLGLIEDPNLENKFHFHK